MPRGWVNHRLIFIFGWTNTLRLFHTERETTDLLLLTVMGEGGMLNWPVSDGWFRTFSFTARHVLVKIRQTAGHRLCDVTQIRPAQHVPLQIVRQRTLVFKNIQYVTKKVSINKHRIINETKLHKMIPRDIFNHYTFYYFEIDCFYIFCFYCNFSESFSNFWSCCFCHVYYYYYYFKCLLSFYFFYFCFSYFYEFFF